MKTLYQEAGCCSKQIETYTYKPCAIVNVEGGPSTGFTCTEAKSLFCSADSAGNIEIDDCELCYGIPQGDCALPADVASVVVDSPTHTVLEQAVTTANLVSTLQGEGPFTVFAPTDTAFAAALTALDLTAAQLLASDSLTPILKHHVLTSQVLSSDLVSGAEVTTFGGEKVTVTISDGAVFIDGAKVTTADVKTRNGVVHVIDKVLLPPSMQPAPLPASVASIVIDSPDHTVLEQAVTTANLVSTLQGDGPFTIFAPTDAAFQAALTALGLTAAELLASDTLPPILKHHVLTSKVLSGDLVNGAQVMTLGGGNVTVTISGDGVFIDGAKVTTADVQAQNGVVHVIDKVLLPAASPSSPAASCEDVAEPFGGSVWGSYGLPESPKTCAAIEPQVRVDWGQYNFPKICDEATTVADYNNADTGFMQFGVGLEAPSGYTNEAKTSELCCATCAAARRRS